jgi:cytochrome P450
MDAVTSPRRFVPPVPPPPEQPLSLRAFLRAVRGNALTIWPAAAYQQDVSIRNFFGRVNVLLNAPEAIHHVLVDNHANYRRSPASIRILRPIMGGGLVLSQGEDWRLQRRTVAPALAPRVMPMLARHVAATAQAALDRQQTGDRVDLLAAMQFLALEVAGRSMFSMEMHEHGAAMRGMLTEFSRHYAQPYLLDMLLPPSIPTLRDFARRRFQRRWMALIEDMMRDRLGAAPPEVPRDLFDLLRAARDPETEAGFSPAQLRDQVATLILAGHETTAVTLFWALTLLAQAPDEQARLADEVREAALGPDQAFATVASLVRTKAVVNETLRLFPPAFTLVREAIASDSIGELTLPPRSVVMIAPWVLHRHHRLWADPAVFDPSRFMPDAPPPPRFAFLPFGAGPRICVGAQFAMTEAILVLASFIQRFRVELADDRPVLPAAVITTQPDHAPPFRLTRR